MLEVRVHSHCTSPTPTCAGGKGSFTVHLPQPIPDPLELRIDPERPLYFRRVVFSRSDSLRTELNVWIYFCSKKSERRVIRRHQTSWAQRSCLPTSVWASGRLSSLPPCCTTCCTTGLNLGVREVSSSFFFPPPPPPYTPPQPPFL